MAFEARTSVRTVESTRALGHGFSVVVVAEPVSVEFESVGHFSYCFYRKLDLGRCDRLFASPTGKFALYQVASTGLVMQFDSRLRRSTTVTPHFLGLLESATWDEPKRIVAFTVGPPASKAISHQY